MLRYFLFSKLSKTIETFLNLSFKYLIKKLLISKFDLDNKVFSLFFKKTYKRFKIIIHLYIENL